MRSVVELKESEVRQNAKAGVLVMDGGEARLGASCAVKENESQALFAAARGNKGGVILKHSKAAVTGAAVTEGSAQIQAW